MKKFLLAIASLLIAGGAFAQADKPDIMVVPSDNWFYSNGYFTVSMVNSKERKLPDYQRAFTENPDINNVITTIAQMFINRGFQTTNVWDEIKALEEENAEEMALDADGEGEASVISVQDMVLATVKPDIKLEINWQVNQIGFNKNAFVNIDGKDSFTNKSVAPMQRQSNDMASSTAVTTLLKEAVEGGFEQLSNNLMTYFTDLSTKGREIRLSVRVTQNAEVNLTSDINGQRLQAILQDWVRQHSLRNTGNLAPNSTKNKANFRGIRIPLADSNGVKMDASEWARKEGLENFLKNLGVPARVDSRGLGEIIVRIGAE